eukprot:RCo007814
MPGPQALGGAGMQQLCDEVLHRIGDLWSGRELQLLVNDVGKGLRVALALVRSEPVQHLKNQNAEAPPVHRGIVTLVGDDLGGQILHSAHKAVEPGQGPASRGDLHLIPDLHHVQGVRGGLLAEVKVCQAEVARLVDQNVLGFQVSIDKVVDVQVLQSNEDLCCVELSGLFREPAVGLLPEEVEELPTCAVLHDKIELRLALEGVVQGGDKRVVGLHEHLPLRQKPVHLVASQHVPFSQHLHRVQLSTAPLHHQVDATHIPLPQQSKHLEVLGAHKVFCEALCGVCLLARSLPPQLLVEVDDLPLQVRRLDLLRAQGGRGGRGDGVAVDGL